MASAEGICGYGTGTSVMVRMGEVPSPNMVPVWNVEGELEDALSEWPRVNEQYTMPLCIHAWIHSLARDGSGWGVP